MFTAARDGLYKCFFKEPEMDNPQNFKPEFVVAQSTSDEDPMDLLAPVQVQVPSQVTCSNSLLVCFG